MPAVSCTEGNHADEFTPGREVIKALLDILKFQLVFFFSEEDVLIHSMSNGMVKKHVSEIRSDISKHIRVTNGNVTLLKPFVKYRHTILIAEVFRAIHSVFCDPKNVS